VGCYKCVTGLHSVQFQKNYIKCLTFFFNFTAANARSYSRGFDTTAIELQPQTL